MHPCSPSTAELPWEHCAVSAVPPSHQVLGKVRLLPLGALFQPLVSQVVLGLSLEMDVVAPDNNIHFLGLRSWIFVFRASLVFISVFIILRFMRF